LTGNNFPLTNFPNGYQTWKNEKNEFQEFGFLKTNKALVFLVFFIDLALLTKKKLIKLIYFIL
jgi:hypothetical protein